MMATEGREQCCHWFWPLPRPTVTWAPWLQIHFPSLAICIKPNNFIPQLRVKQSNLQG